MPKKVSIERQTEPVDKNKKKHRTKSMFILTVNSNQTEEALGDDGIQLFEQRCINLLTLFPDKLVLVNEHYPDTLNEAEFSFKYAFETSNKFHKYHMHSYIQIKHSTNIKIDFDLLATTMEPYGYYANCKFSFNNRSGADMKAYVRKGL